MTRRLPRRACREFDPAWLFVPAVLALLLIGAFLLAGVLEQMPAHSTPASVDAGAVAASAGGT